MIWFGPAAGGVGRYARELVGALLALRPELRLHLVVSRDVPDDLRAEPWARDVRWEVMPVRLTGPPFHLAAQLAGLPALALARRVALVHGLANVVPVRIPRVRTVVTLHDLIWLHESGAWGDARAVRAVRRLSLASARGADRVLAVSHAAARDFTETIGLDAARIDVAPHGVSDAKPALALDEATLRSLHELGDAPVILCVAQKRPYKNLAALIRAFAELRDERATLVLPGGADRARAQLRELARRLGVAERVRFLGLGLRGRARGRSTDGVLLCPAVADRGVRTAGARGDGARRSGRLLGPSSASRGRRRRRAAVRSRRPGAVTAALHTLLGTPTRRRARPTRPEQRAGFSWRGLRGRRSRAIAARSGVTRPWLSAADVIVVRGHLATPWELRRGARAARALPRLLPAARRRITTTSAT